MKRAIVIVLDSVGIGHAPDAETYGDKGANTVGHILENNPKLRLPNLYTLGIREALDIAAGNRIAQPKMVLGSLISMSAGKDTTTGHWEIAGATTTTPLATYKEFPKELIDKIEEEADTTFIGNITASGTEILSALGTEHVATGNPIIYTSADSVLQIAAHEDIVPIQRLYEICKIARKYSDVGRVIARPFKGHGGAWQRTANRHDFSLIPPPTVLNELISKGIPVTGVGKISDIFAGSGISKSLPTKSNKDGMETISKYWNETNGLLFANLVDFDSLYGHRRDIAGYGKALEEFDCWFGTFIGQVTGNDLVIITADHGNDPTWHGTDHTREQVPYFEIHQMDKKNLGQIRGFDYVSKRLKTYFQI